MELLSTAKTAEILGVSERRVRALIAEGRLPAQKIDRDHLIREEDLALVAERKTGRPKKTENAAKSEISQEPATAEEPKPAKKSKKKPTKAKAR